MKLILYSIVAWLLLCVGAYAQGCGPTNPNCVVPTAPPGTSDNRAASTAFVQSSGGTVINVLSYGAKCDGVTDDSTAINKASAAASAISNGPQSLFSVSAVVLQFPPNLRCLIRSPINFTGNRTTTNPLLKGFITHGVVIKDAFIFCAVGGGTCLDGLGAAFLTWDNVNLQGSSTPGLEPKYGIVVGIIDNKGADQNKFHNIQIRGNFLNAGYYNFSAEIANWSQFDVTNLDVNGYSVILDGINHWNITSTFQTETNPTDTQVTFQDHYFGPGELAGGKGVWIAGAGRPRFNGTYANTFGNCVVTLYYLSNTSTFNFSGGIFDMHLEAFPTDYICIDGPALSPQTYNFRFATENAVLATNSLFKIVGSATSVTYPGIDLQIVNSSSNGAFKIFDDPTKWHVSGNVKISSSTGETADTVWNAPSEFSGSLCLAKACKLGYTSPTLGSVLRLMDLDANQFFTLSGGTNAAAANSNIGIGTAALSAIAPGVATNYNTALGFHAAASLTTADHVTAIGVFSCGAMTDTTGGHNSCFGIDSMRFITSGVDNTVVGEQAINGVGDTFTSNQNTAVGRNAMLNNGGDHNTALGYFTMSGPATGSLTGTYNTSVGAQAGGNIGGVAASNTIVGGLAGSTQTTASNNTLIGFQAGKGVTTGASNTIVGTNVGITNPTTGSGNTLIGVDNNTGAATGATAGAVGIGQFVHPGTDDSCIGKGACNATTEDGNASAAVGRSALLAVTTGDFNVAVGRQAGQAITSGASNVVLGQTTGASIIGGSSNIIIGQSVDTPSATDASNTINIGNVHKVTGWNAPTTAAQTLTGTVTVNKGVVHSPLTFATLPTSTAGTTAYITDGLAGNCGDGTCTTFGTTVTAGTGAIKLLVWFNGTNWTLTGK